MVRRETVSVQRGIWIDGQRLADADLHDRLQITVRPGEIRIRSAKADGVSQGDVAHERLLELAGILSGSPLSANQIERELYGDQAGQQ